MAEVSGTGSPQRHTAALCHACGERPAEDGRYLCEPCDQQSISEANGSLDADHERGYLYDPIESDA